MIKGFLYLFVFRRKITFIRRRQIVNERVGGCERRERTKVAVVSRYRSFKANPHFGETLPCSGRTHLLINKRPNQNKEDSRMPVTCFPPKIFGSTSQKETIKNTGRVAGHGTAGEIKIKLPENGLIFIIEIAHSESLCVFHP